MIRRRTRIVLQYGITEAFTKWLKNAKDIFSYSKFSINNYNWSFFVNWNVHTSQHMVEVLQNIPVSGHGYSYRNLERNELVVI